MVQSEGQKWIFLKVQVAVENINVNSEAKAFQTVFPRQPSRGKVSDLVSETTDMSICPPLISGNCNLMHVCCYDLLLLH